jgi:succinyl-CoA synthetase alpha subunit
MGHAGAIVSGNVGSYEGKRRALEAAGVAVADTPSEIPRLVGLPRSGSVDTANVALQHG